VVQALPSLQLLVLFVWTQPVAGLHESSVQTLPSPQLLVVPLHTPIEHLSFVVHALPSSQLDVLLVWTHRPVLGLQKSLVHGLPSSQL
jgi:hypothetical protein